MMVRSPQPVISDRSQEARATLRWVARAQVSLLTISMFLFATTVGGPVAFAQVVGGNGQTGTKVRAIQAPTAAAAPAERPLCLSQPFPIPTVRRSPAVLAAAAVLILAASCKTGIERTLRKKLRRALRSSRLLYRRRRLPKLAEVSLRIKSRAQP